MYYRDTNTCFVFLYYAKPLGHGKPFVNIWQLLLRTHFPYPQSPLSSRLSLREGGSCTFSGPELPDILTTQGQSRLPCGLCCPHPQNLKEPLLFLEIWFPSFRSTKEAALSGICKIQVLKELEQCGKDQSLENYLGLSLNPRRQKCKLSSVNFPVS